MSRTDAAAMEASLIAVADAGIDSASRCSTASLPLFPSGAPISSRSTRRRGG